MPPDATSADTTCYGRITAPLSRALARRPPMPGGYVVRDANGQALAYIYSRDNPTEALQAKMLTKDEARRIAVNIAGCRRCWGRPRATRISPLLPAMPR
jgi:hypothetical protein